MPGSPLKEIARMIRDRQEKLLLPRIEKMLLARNGEGGHDVWLHPSAVGGADRICPRRFFYHRHAPEELRPKELAVVCHSPRTHRIFDNGEFLHLRYQVYLIEAGVMDPRRGIGWEVPVRDEELGITGHADGIVWPEAENRITVRKLRTGHGESAYPVLTEDGLVWEGEFEPKGEPYLLEIKSISDRYFQNLAAPVQAHRVQATCYMALLGLKACLFLYESKDNQKVKEFLYPFNPEYWAEIEGSLRKAARARRTGTLPQRVCESALCEMARECEWVSVCFSPSAEKAIAAHLKGKEKEEGRK